MNAARNTLTAEPIENSIRRIDSHVYTANSSDEVLKALKFRFEVYYLEMARDKKYAHPELGIVKDSQDEDAIHIIAEDRSSGRVIGSARLNFAMASSLPENELYHFTDFQKRSRNQLMCLVTKVMIAKEYRGSLLFLELVKQMYLEAKKRNVRFCFLATNDHLVRLFERIGFKQHQPRTTWADYGSSNPMVIDLHDTEHLHSCRSPVIKWQTPVRNIDTNAAAKSNGFMSRLPSINWSRMLPAHSA